MTKVFRMIISLATLIGVRVAAAEINPYSFLSSVEGAKGIVRLQDGKYHGDCSGGAPEEAKVLPLGGLCKTSVVPCESELLCSPAIGECVPPPLAVVGGLWDQLDGVVAGFEDKKKDTYVVPLGSPIISNSNVSRTVDYGGLGWKKRIWVDKQVIWSRNSGFGYRFTKAPRGTLGVQIGMKELWREVAGGRRFHIEINGKRVEENLDVFAEAGGKAKVLSKTYYVAVPEEGNLEVQFKRGGRASDNPMVNFIAVSIPTGDVCEAMTVECDKGFICSELTDSCVLPPLTVVGGHWDVANGIVAGWEAKPVDTYVVPHGSIYIYFVRHLPIADYGDLEEKKRVWAKTAVVWSLEDFGYHFKQAQPGKVVVRIGVVDHWRNAAGGRLFQIEINGEKVEKNLDVVAEAGGRGRVLLKTYHVTVKEKGALNIEFKRGSARKSDVPIVNFIEVSRAVGGFCKAGKVACGSGLLCLARTESCVPPALTVVAGLWDAAKGIVSGWEDKSKDTTVVPLGAPFVKPGPLHIVDYGDLEEGKRAWVDRAKIWTHKEGFGYRFKEAPRGKLAVRIGMAEHEAIGPRSRLFHIEINGDKVERSLDLFLEAGGRGKVLLKTYYVTVQEKGALSIQFTRASSKASDTPRLNFIEVSPVGAFCKTGVATCGSGLLCSEVTNSCVPPPLTVVGGLWDVTNGIVAGSLEKSKDTSVVPHGTVLLYPNGHLPVADYGGLGEKERVWIKNAVIWSNKEGFGYHFNEAPRGRVMVRVGAVEHWRHVAGTRLFHIEINGEQVERNLDVFTEAGGKHKALLKTYYVVVKEKGALIVEFKRGSRHFDNPLIHFIEVRKASEMS